MEQTNSGDANRITRAYFDSLLIEMRHIGAAVPDTKLTLYGETFETPVMTAALSHLDKCHPGGMAELARGAKAAGAVMWAGMGEDEELTRITAAGAKTIKIIKPHADSAVILRRIAHAEQCGCIAVGMDIDHAFNGRGEQDIVLGLPMAGKTLDDIRRFVSATKLPFIIKGVLSVRDALLCAQAGVKGIVVSHHHGILDYAAPPLLMLPEIVRAAGGDMPVFLDCGAESGLDVFKALALGATAVSVGRALMGPLSENGAEGAADAIRKMTAQLAGAMARTCSPGVAHIDGSVLRERRGW
ncbi:MAG: alpha-hydroxy-acid oxidizing protein [Oscillospiraceae bacterium]|jgi:isopentenyl diphosphate isomerase/L-lactate dehydrogenase-like FMN-dependent dehydrogenase|nr:alpha-hydroxy-acid oxidizing protein [Oscillospiraceae bacterium]